MLLLLLLLHGRMEVATACTSRNAILGTQSALMIPSNVGRLWTSGPHGAQLGTAAALWMVVGLRSPDTVTFKSSIIFVGGLETVTWRCEAAKTDDHIAVCPVAHVLSVSRS